MTHAALVKEIDRILGDADPRGFIAIRRCRSQPRKFPGNWCSIKSRWKFGAIPFQIRFTIRMRFSLLSIPAARPASQKV